jgi:hypothetical protein
MSQLVLQVLIVVAFSAFCFGCGYLTAFVVTRNQCADRCKARPPCPINQGPPQHPSRYRCSWRNVQVTRRSVVRHNNPA